MRISTSYFNVKKVLSQETDEIWQNFISSSGRKGLTQDLTTWHWLLEEAARVPKNFGALYKSNPKDWLNIGLSRGYLTLKLSLRADHVKVWQTETLNIKLLPKEILNHVLRKASDTKWDGVILDVFTPLNLLHPGLAQYACVCALKDRATSEVVVFLTDKGDPMAQKSWQAFSLNTIDKACIPMYVSLTLEKLRDIEYDQDAIVFSGRQFEYLNSEQLLTSLNGIKKFTMVMDRASAGLAAIPTTVRKFKLGEELGVDERKSISLDTDFIAKLA